MSRQLQKEGMRLALDEEENDETCDKRSQSKTPEAESSTAPKTSSLSPKSPTVPDFTCWYCHKSLYGARFVNKDGHPYCVDCYNAQFTHHCNRCHGVISVDDKDLAFKDKHWHDTCFKCYECSASLVDKSFGTREESLYCSDCWDLKFAPKCKQCLNSFKAGATKLTWNGSEWHKECFACSNCEKIIGQEAFHPQDDKPYCEDCWEDLFAVKCTKCLEAIKEGGVTYKMEPYHKECFACDECGNSLAGQRFTLKENKPICPICFGKLYAKKCLECGKPITGVGGNRYIIFEGSHWHTQCFNCKECGISLVGINLVAEGYGDDLETFCQPCGLHKRGKNEKFDVQARREKENSEIEQAQAAIKAEPNR